MGKSSIEKEIMLYKSQLKDPRYKNKKELRQMIRSREKQLALDIQIKKERSKPKKTQEKKKEELPRKAQRRGKKLTKKQSKSYTFKKGGPDTIIGYPTKKGKGLHKVEYKNTAKNRRKYLDQNIG